MRSLKAHKKGLEMRHGIDINNSLSKVKVRFQKYKEGGRIFKENSKFRENQGKQFVNNSKYPPYL